MCDLCVHIRFNPVGTIYYKHQDPVLKSRKIEEPPAKQAKMESETNLCSLCLGKKRSGVTHSCSQSSKKRNLLGIMQGLPEKAQKKVVGSAVTILARSETEQSTSHSVGVTLRRVEGGHSVKFPLER